jgi:cell division protein FtsN
MAMNTNRIIELCLVFLVSILSFSVGTFVGKKYSDNQHKLSLLDPNYNKHESIADEASAHTPSEAHGTETAAATVAPANDEHGSPIKANITNSTPITDADVAKMAEEFSEENTEDLVDTSKADSGSIVKTINEDGSVVPDEPKAKAKKEATKLPAKKVAKVNGETVVREVANISERAQSIHQDVKASDSADGKSQYTVQVGAFPSPTEAEKIASSLQARGYKASHSVATVNGKTWYRVQVGLFNSLQDAQVYKKELVEQNHLTSAIIQRLNK